MGTSSALSTSNQYIKYKITITQNSQSVTNNTSNVTVSVKFYRTNTGYTTYGTGTVYCTINGTEYSAAVTSSQKITESGIVLFSKTLNIAHSTDGTKTLKVSAYIDHQRVTSEAQSYSQTLTTIARKSTLTASNGTLGTAQTLTINRQSSSFTHTITYKCGTASGTITTKTTSTSVSFTPPLSLASQNTTGTSVSITFTITTYSGSTSIGSNTKTISCSIPSSVKPSCTVAISDAAGYLATYGKYIKGLSKFKVTVTAEKAYNSAISSYTVKANGATYTKSSFTTGVLASSGTLKVTATVKDNRGRKSDTASVSAEVYDYSAPVITSLKVKRCDEDGTENAKGEYVQVIFSSKVTGLDSKNTASYLLEYKKTNDADYTKIPLTDYNNVFELTDAGYKFAADTGSSYDVRVTVADNFYNGDNAISNATNVSTASVIMHWHSSGDGIGLGKVCERPNIVDAGYPIVANAGFENIVLLADTDLNGVMQPNVYIGVNVSSNNYGNCPVTSGTFTLEVMSAGEVGQLMQRLTVCSKVVSCVYTRFYYQGSWGEWLITSASSQWRDLTISSGFERYNAESTPKYRINGNLVTVTGAVTPTATVTSGITVVEFASGIDVAFAPARSTQFVCQGSGINRWELSISPEGKLYVARYGKNEYVDISAGSWLTFCATYSI